MRELSPDHIPMANNEVEVGNNDEDDNDNLNEIEAAKGPHEQSMCQMCIYLHKPCFKRGVRTNKRGNDKN